MYNFYDIETYVLWLGGFITPDNPGVITAVQPPSFVFGIDQTFLQSVAVQVSCSKQLTDKQHWRLVKYIHTHRNQIIRHCINLPPEIETIPSRLGIRISSSTKEVSIQDEKIFVRFPFDEHIATCIRNISLSSSGWVQWDADARAWTLAITEPTLVAISEIAKVYKFSTTAEFDNLVKMVEDEEQKVAPSVKLVKEPSGSYGLVNATNSLLELVSPVKHEQLKFIDYAGMGKYEIDTDIVVDLLKLHDAKYVTNFLQYCCNRYSWVTQVDELSDVFKWAHSVGRYPIVLNPGLKYMDETHTALIKQFGKDNVSLVATHDKNHKRTKVVYTSKILKKECDTSLLISFITMIHGPTKKEWFNKFEKIVFLGHNINDNSNDYY